MLLLVVTCPKREKNKKNKKKKWNMPMCIWVSLFHNTGLVAFRSCTLAHKGATGRRQYNRLVIELIA